MSYLPLWWVGKVGMVVEAPVAVVHVDVAPLYELLFVLHVVVSLPNQDPLLSPYMIYGSLPRPCNLANDSSFGPYRISATSYLFVNGTANMGLSYLSPFYTEGIHLESVQVPSEALIERP